jgi:hypothetical protein
MATSTTTRTQPTQTDTTPTAPADKPTALPIRPTPTPASRWPEFITHAMITAHYQARLHNLPTRSIRDWRHLPNGGAVLPFPSGARLDHTPTADAPFHANTPCHSGGTHRDPVHGPHDLTAAEARANTCTTRHAPKTAHLGARLQIARKAAADTQPLTRDDIDAGLTTRADNDQPKEHPQP